MNGDMIPGLSPDDFQKGDTGYTREFETVFRDNFDTGALDMSKWSFDDLVDDALNRAGNGFLDAAGNIMPHKYNSAPGARWSAMYNKHHDKTAVVVPDGDYLRFMAHIEEIRNPLRHNFTHDGILHPAGDFIQYAAMLKSWAQKWSNKHEAWITDHDKPNFQFGPEHYLEFTADLSRMCQRGQRFSLWLMPSTLDDEFEDKPSNPALSIAGGDTAYDDDPDNGVEIDFERENPRDANADFGHTMFHKVIGGDILGDTPNGDVDARKFGVDLNKPGYHRHGIMISNDDVRWYLNRLNTNRDPDRVPKCLNHIIMSNEICSGVKGPGDDPKEGDIRASGPKQPRAPGLSGQSSILDRHLIPEHEARLDSVRVYKMHPYDRKFLPPNAGSKPAERTCPVCGQPIEAAKHNHDADIELGDMTLATGEIWTAPVLKRCIPIVGNPYIKWANVGAHKYNVERNGLYIDTVAAPNSIDGNYTVEDKGTYTVQAISDDAQSWSPKSNEVTL